MSGISSWCRVGIQHSCAFNCTKVTINKNMVTFNLLQEAEILSMPLERLEKLAPAWWTMMVIRKWTWYLEAAWQMDQMDQMDMFNGVCRKKNMFLFQHDAFQIFHERCRERFKGTPPRLLEVLEVYIKRNASKCFFFICLFLGLLEALQGTSSTFSRRNLQPFKILQMRCKRFFCCQFSHPKCPNELPQKIWPLKESFFHILSRNLTTGQQELPRSQRDSQSISERRWDAVLSVEGLLFWLKLCVTSSVRQHSGLANRYHARDSWSMQMPELKQLYSPATKDTEKRKIWYYDFLRFQKKKSETNVQKICDVFSLESCGFTKVHDNLQSSVPWWFFKYRSWNNLGNI